MTSKEARKPWKGNKNLERGEAGKFVEQTGTEKQDCLCKQRDAAGILSKRVQRKSPYCLGRGN
jgi:hypothetical protein